MNRSFKSTRLNLEEWQFQSFNVSLNVSSYSTKLFPQLHCSDKPDHDLSQTLTKSFRCLYITTKKFNNAVLMKYIAYKHFTDTVCVYPSLWFKPKLSLHIFLQPTPSLFLEKQTLRVGCKLNMEYGDNPQRRRFLHSKFAGRKVFLLHPVC